MARRESTFQAKLIKELKSKFQGCVILKNDANYIQGICDLLILFGTHWAMLECKASKDSKHRPNQEYYVNKFNNMSYATFVYPENKDQVISELCKVFETSNKNELYFTA